MVKSSEWFGSGGVNDSLVGGNEPPSCLLGSIKAIDPAIAFFRAVLVNLAVLLEFVAKQISIDPININEEITGKAEVLDIFKVSKVGKVAGSKVLNGEINQDSNARIIRDGIIIFNGKVGSIFREKNQVKQVNAGLECGISLKDFNDFQIKDIIEAYRSKIIERQI